MSLLLTVTEGLANLLIKIGLEKVGLWIKNWSVKKEVDIGELKRATRVLFVDDESFEDRLQPIRESGWMCSQIPDIKNLDDEHIQNAQIIFMDYKGVGGNLTPSEEGIGLCKALRKKYPKKKIIFYSGYAGHIPGDEVFSFVDGWIAKHADTYEYIDLIEATAREVYGNRKR